MRNLLSGILRSFEKTLKRSRKGKGIKSELTVDGPPKADPNS
jgi:hypothetical protein